MYRVVGDWMRGTEVLLPSQLVEAGLLTIGGHPLQLLSLTGHTGADLVILDQRTGVLFAGDLVFYQRALATPNTPGLAAWLADIDSLEKLPWKLIVPGHGPLASDAQPFVQMRDYLTWLDSALREAAQTGQDMNQVLRLPIPERFAQVSLTRYELIRTVSHLYPLYEKQQWQRLDQE
jgi:glyoxylase-like metal-dependent hydrolase (beta-lactamase superfamily II)